MWSRSMFLRLFSIFAVINIGFLLHDVSAQTTAAPHLPSALPGVWDECPWGYTYDNGQCRPVRIPDNAFLDFTGHNWACERGYKRSHDRCVPVEVPAHAYLDYAGHDWACERGYKRSHDRCVPVKVPDHAYLDYFGHDWVCQRGYHRVGSQCIRIELPVHAHLDYTGNDWECNPGYQRIADTCQTVGAQHAKTGIQILPLIPSPEIKQTVRQMQQKLKQAGYDPGPIDGVLGPKTLTALQQYLATQARVFVQDTPSQPHPKNGEQG